MLQLAQVSIRSGSLHLHAIDLKIAAGEHVVLTGPTGVGKTTLIEAITGLRPITSGAILLKGVDCCSVQPVDRHLGYVPQDGTLFTTMSVGANLAYGLRARGWTTEATRQRVQEVATSLGIQSLLERDTRSLSGGEARRVAIGRAIAFRPEVLLLDEPTTGLDGKTRDEVYQALDELRSDTRPAILHATHDRSAERLADRVVRIEEGVLSEVGQAVKPSIAIDRATAS